MDYKAEQEMEVEALESILMDDFSGMHIPCSTVHAQLRSCLLENLLGGVQHAVELTARRRSCVGRVKRLQLPPTCTFQATFDLNCRGGRPISKWLV